MRWSVAFIQHMAWHLRHITFDKESVARGIIMCNARTQMIYHIYVFVQTKIELRKFRHIPRPGYVRQFGTLL
jgi:hypothetical protein